MAQKRSKPAPLATGTGSRTAKLSGFGPDSTNSLPEVQACFLVARFGLDGARARVVAELAWGGR